jgi:hypothetical protein
MPRSLSFCTGIILFISALLAACESPPKKGLEWKEIVLEKEGVSIECPVDFSSPLQYIGEDQKYIFCNSAEADYALSVEPWDVSDDPDENRYSAFKMLKERKLSIFERITIDTVMRGDLMVQEFVGFDSAAANRSPIDKLYSTDPKIVYFTRAFVIGKKLYRMGVSYNVPDRDSYVGVLNNMREDREKFFASFHILNKK